MITHQRLQIIVLSIIFAIIAIIVAMMWWPFLTFIAMGAILAILFQPIYKKLVKETGHETVSAWLTIILILLIVMVPLYIIGQLSFNELVSVYNHYKGGSLNWNQSEAFGRLPENVRTVISNFSGNLAQKLSGLASNAFATAAGLVTNIAGFFLSFFLVFFTAYYLLKDGDRIKKYLGSIFPLSPSHEDLLVTKLERAINGVVKGQFLVALIQGSVALIGFLIFGVPQPVLWATFTVFAALVPNVGTSLAVIPAVLLLLLTGHIGAGIGMAIWGAAAVGTIDNIISPRIVGSRIDVHPLLILFSVLGGLQLFGVLGVLLGPILMSVFVTMVEIFRTDLKEYLEK